MTEAPPVFSPEMEEACCIIERVVNEEMKKRARFPLEWDGGGSENDAGWRSNVAAANCYEGGQESVGLVYLLWAVISEAECGLGFIPTN